MNYAAIKSLNNQIDEKILTLDALKESIEGINSEILHLGDIQTLLKQSKSHKIETRKTFILDIINKAIADIINDKQIKVDIISSEGTGNKYNIVYDFVIYKNGTEIARNNTVFDTTGGGVISIISFILKIMMGYINTGNKFYIFDESFSQLSVNYLSSLSMFLRKLCEDYGFTLLMITHNELYEYAHIHYEFDSDKDDKLKLVNTNINGDETFNITSDFYRIEATYFQSIENIKLDIKGLTVLTGPSDIGKSAIMRAINSIILNDFKPTYESNFRKRGKYTEIILSKHKTEEIFDFIKMIYKQGTVYYYLQNGTEYKGKALANDKIVSLLETFGFKRVDTSIYKNWSSNLKAQTERVFVTTQHDSSYFSSEKNATEKLLTLLFNSHMFNDAISTVESEIKEKQDGIKDILQNIEFEENELIKLHIRKDDAKIQFIDSYNAILNKINEENVIHIENMKQVDFNIEMYNGLIEKYRKINLIDSYDNLCDIESNNQIILNDIEFKISVSDDIVESLNQLINIDRYIDNINTYESNLIEHNTSLNTITNIISTFDIILHSADKATKIQKYIDLNNSIKLSKIDLFDITNKSETIEILIDDLSKLNTIENGLNRYYHNITQATDNIELCKKQYATTVDKINNIEYNINMINHNIENEKKIETINTYVSLINNVKTIENNVININNDIEELDVKYNLQKCQECGGIGYVHNH